MNFAFCLPITLLGTSDVCEPARASTFISGLRLALGFWSARHAQMQISVHCRQF